MASLIMVLGSHEEGSQAVHTPTVAFETSQLPKPVLRISIKTIRIQILPRPKSLKTVFFILLMNREHLNVLNL